MWWREIFELQFLILVIYSLVASGQDCENDWLNDGECDDENNNAGCNYDSGDCCNEDWFGDGDCDEINNFFSCSGDTEKYTTDGGDCTNKTCFSNSNDPLLKALIAKYGSSWSTDERYLAAYDTNFPNTIIPNERSCKNLMCKADEENIYDKIQEAQVSTKSYVKCVWLDSLSCECMGIVDRAFEQCYEDFDTGKQVCQPNHEKSFTGLAATLQRPQRPKEK